jgi:hypothetical protein
LRVWIYVTAPLDAADRDAARLSADGLLAAAGVTVEWRTCDAAAACSRATDPSPNVTLILTSARRRSCGMAALDGRGRSATVLISVPCVTDLVYDVIHGPAGRSEPLLLALQPSHLLGAAIAHELGHVLGLAHAGNGVMRAWLDRGSLLELQRGVLRFTRREAEAMRTSRMSQGLTVMAAEPTEKP